MATVAPMTVTNDQKQILNVAEVKSEENKSDEKKSYDKKSDEKKSNEKKSDDKKSDDKKSDDKKSDDKKSDDKKSDEKKSEEKKSEENKPEENELEVINVNEENSDIVVIAYIKAKTGATKREIQQPNPENSQVAKRGKMDVEAAMPPSPPVEGSPWATLMAMHPKLEYYLHRGMYSDHFNRPHGNSYIVNVKIGDHIFEGTGFNRKVAKAEAAKKALLFLFGIKFK